MGKRAAADTVTMSEDIDRACKRFESAPPPELDALLPVIRALRGHPGGAMHMSDARPIKYATAYGSVAEVAKEFTAKYKGDDASSYFVLKDEILLQNAELADNTASVINTLRNSKYFMARGDELYSRTILELIIVDRLEKLSDNTAHEHLSVHAEVSLTAYGSAHQVVGTADWALSHAEEKDQTDTILLVIEAKRRESGIIGLPQLFVYLATVSKARKKKGKNHMIFGMLSDNSYFTFACVLDDNDGCLQFYRTIPYAWGLDSASILNTLDYLLASAIASSPSTSPQKGSQKTTPGFVGLEFGRAR